MLRVPQSYGSIQAAVNAATPGDTILVDPGDYAENIYVGKRIHMLANGAPGKVVVRDPENVFGSGPYTRFVFYLDSSEGGELSGFDIIGLYEINGAGVHVENGAWRVTRCRLKASEKGIASSSAPVTLLDNLIEEHSQVGIMVGGGSTVIGNLLRENNQGISLLSTALVANNVVLNSFVGIQVTSDSAVVVNNTISTVGTTNYASQQIGIWMDVNGRSAIENNLVAFGGRDGVRADASGVEGTTTFRYNNVVGHHQEYNLPGNAWNMTGYAGNVSFAPSFADNPGEVYLSSNSPLIDRGAPSIVDLNGTRSDIGAYGGPLASSIRYAPSSFFLTSPANSAVVTGPVSLAWEAAYDLDPDDEISYRVLIAKEAEICYLHPSVYRTCLRGTVDTLTTAETSISVALSDTTAYFWTVEAVDTSGLYKRAGEVRTFLPQATVGTDGVAIGPLSLDVYPNPSDALTTFRFTLSRPARARLLIYDALGRSVAEVMSGHVDGVVAVPFDARSLAPGAYVARLETDGAPTATIRFTVTR